MQKNNTIVAGVHFFLDSNVNDWLVNGFNESGEEKCAFGAGDCFSYDLIDQPFHCSIDCDGADARLRVYVRNELGGYTDEMIDGELVLHMDTDEMELVKDSERIGELRTASILMMFAGHQLRKHVLARQLMPEFADMDLDDEGILVLMNDEEPIFRRVSGKKRPAMACTTLFGGVEMMRPYFNEIMDLWAAESLDLDELLEEAEYGDENAMERLALAYLNGDEALGLVPDAEQAFYWLMELALQGSPNGQFNVGLHYAKGFGVERNFEQAAYWMEEAAKNGDTDAPVLAGEFKRAIEAMSLAEQGDAQAQADLARIFMQLGTSLDQAGPQKDFADAFVWAEKAAAQNNGDGLWTLALAYEHGRGVKKDTKKAVELYQRGADVNHAPSQHSLGCYYMRGEVVPKDEEKAFQLIRKSADQGYELAYRALGTCYQFGNGVRDDMTEAIRWYEKYLETNRDEELERKVGVFKMLNACVPTDDELEQYAAKAESNLPEGYLEALEAFAAEVDEEEAPEETVEASMDWMSGKLFVTTGLSHTDQTRAEQIITENGGILKGSVVLDTNYVIYDTNFGETKKLKRAKELIAKGKPIQLLTVQKFGEMLQSAAPKQSAAPSVSRENLEHGCTVCLLEGDQLKCWVQKLTVIKSGIPLEDSKLIFEVYNLSEGEYHKAADGDEDVSYAGLFGLDAEILEARRKLDASLVSTLGNVKGKTVEQLVKKLDRYESIRKYFKGGFDGLREFDWLPVAPAECYHWIEMAPVTQTQYERYADELHHVYYVAELFGTRLPFDLNDPETATIFGSGKFEAFADLSYGC